MDFLKAHADKLQKLSKTDFSILVEQQSQSGIGTSDAFSHEYTTGSKVSLKKCSCSSSWCPACFKRGRSIDIAKRLQAMKWRSVRMVTLTIDRRLFSDPQECFEYITEKKVIAEMMKNLKRTKGLCINDWIWILEWHKDGYPHWHLVIENVVSGKDAQIGQQNIHQYWDHGAIYEDYVKSKEHWGYISGYFEKNGYFKHKSQAKLHQMQLPKWALKLNRMIRKTGAKQQRKPKEEGEEMIKPIEEKIPKEKGEEMNKPEINEETQPRTRRSYEVILDDCGANTVVMIQNPFYGHSAQINVPYDICKRWLPDAEYLPRYGLTAQLSQFDLDVFIEKIKGFYFYEYSKDYTNFDLYLSPVLESAIL